MKQLKHGWQSAYRLTLGRLGLRQRLLVMLLLLVTIAIVISFYSEYTIHSDMLETEIAADVDTVATLLLSSLQFRDGQPFLPYDPRCSPLNERLFGEARVRFRIVQVSLTETARVLVQGGGTFPTPATSSLWVRARADTVWHVTKLWLDQERNLRPEPQLPEFQLPEFQLPERQLPEPQQQDDATSTPANAVRVDIALEVSERYAGLAAYLRRELLVMPLTFLITVLLAGWLVQQTLEPLAKLTEATRQRQRFPEPLPVTSERDEIGMLTANFNAMVAEVRGMLERERSFNRYASHELRTPLSTLKAQLEALELGLIPAEQVMPTMQHALADTETILGALLQLSRLEKPRLEPLPLRDVIGQLEQQLASDQPASDQPASDQLANNQLANNQLANNQLANNQLANNQVTNDKNRLQVRPLPDVWLLSHSDLLTQVLSNLISNALKYSCDAVVVSACAQQSTVTVSVRDYGKGVPEDLLAKLTTPFFRVQGNRAKGLGLGLALSEHIIRSLGAEMTFCNIKPSHKSSDDEQDANGGFLAQVTLPLYEASAPS